MQKLAPTIKKSYQQFFQLPIAIMMLPIDFAAVCVR